jgi:hypothetical protein
MKFVAPRMPTGDRGKGLVFAITSVIPVTKHSSLMAGTQPLLREKRRRFEARQ